MICGLCADIVPTLLIMLCYHAYCAYSSYHYSANISIYLYWSIYWVVDCLIHWVRLLITSLLLLLCFHSVLSFIYGLYGSPLVYLFFLECATVLRQAMREHSKQPLSQTWLEIAATAAILACWISFHRQSSITSKLNIDLVPDIKS